MESRLGTVGKVPPGGDAPGTRKKQSMGGRMSGPMAKHMRTQTSPKIAIEKEKGQTS